MKFIVITGINGAVGSVAMHYFSKLGYGIIGIGRKNKNDLPLINQYCTEYFQLINFDEENCKILFDQLIEKKYNIIATICMNGGFLIDSIKNFSPTTFQKLLNNNYLSTLMITKYSLGYFHLQNHGIFIFMSAASTDQPDRFSTSFSYSATKTLINHLAIGLHASESKNNIRIGLVKTGVINTPMNRKEMPNIDQSSWVKPISICEKIQYFIEDSTNPFEELLF